ncbi:MAG: hypothetical protein AUH43_00070 [Acidobacteria bacterium 13_1_40CM_65_14]|nr:MAG: hypothetical protein AUH43_00070 [Acidobacteria bacterium 13_1_40CM_65_14]
MAIERCELDLIGFSIVIHVDDGTDVALFQRLFWHRFSEDDSVKFVDHLLFRQITVFVVPLITHRSELSFLPNPLLFDAVRKRLDFLVQPKPQVRICLSFLRSSNPFFFA